MVPSRTADDKQGSDGSVASVNQLKPGRTMKCEVLSKDENAYTVKILDGALTGVINNTGSRVLNVGDKIYARFLCVHNNKALLTMSFPLDTRTLKKAAAKSDDEAMISRLQKLHLKRASDLIPPAFDQSSESTFDLRKNGIDGLIEKMEVGKRTACVKASSQEWRSRSVMLLNNGRVVGCLYTCMGLPETQPTERSLQLMVSDLLLPETTVVLYDLPETIILPMSALFLGYRIQRDDELDGSGYLSYISDWCKERSVTACIAITLPASATTCLAFIHKGKFSGAHHVESQIFTKEISYVRALLSLDPDADVEATIVPEQSGSAAMPYGFSLSTAKKKFID
jgi:hypothetical protein